MNIHKSHYYFPWLNWLVIIVWASSLWVSAFPAQAHISLNAERSTPFFIQNTGQFKPAARFVIESSRSSLWLTDDGIWLSLFNPPSEYQLLPAGGVLLTGVNLHIIFLGANPHPRLLPDGQLYPRINYLSKDQSIAASAWSSVTYSELYPGIDLTIEASARPGEEELLSWHLDAKDNADLSQVQLRIAGADKVQVAGNHLLLDTSFGKVALPLLDAMSEGSFQPARSGPQISMAGDGLFDVATPLSNFRQPQSMVFQANAADLAYSTYLGGSAWEAAYGIVLGQDGSIYVAGRTASPDFPTTSGAFDRSITQVDAFITKLNAAGDRMIYSTILGGAGADAAYGIALVGDQVYVTGDTQSRDFPTTNGAYDTTCGSDGTCNTGTQGPLPDAFLSQLSSDGSRLLYSTYLGGRDEDRSYSLAVDGQQVFLTGITYSSDFPAAGYKANGDAFVASFDSSHQLAYARLLTGSDVDAGFAIAVRAGEAYVTGETSSLDFPAQPYHAGRDLFLAHLSTTGSIVDASLVGGLGDEIGNAIALDTEGNILVAGWTTSPDLPATSGAYNGNVDALILRANPQTNVSMLVYFGGTGNDRAYGIAADTGGNVWMTGSTNSSDFPVTTQAFQPVAGGAGDAFVAHLNLSTLPSEMLIYSTYIGGAKVDDGQALVRSQADQVYLTGYTQSSDFPMTTGNLDSTLNGVQDVFVVRLSAVGIPGPIPTVPSSTPTEFVPTQTLMPASATAIAAQGATETSAPSFDTTASVTLSSQPSATPLPVSTGGIATPTPSPLGTSGIQASTNKVSTSTIQAISTLTAKATLQPQAVTTQTVAPHGEAGQKASYLWVIAPVSLVVIGIIAWFVYHSKHS